VWDGTGGFGLEAGSLLEFILKELQDSSFQFGLVLGDLDLQCVGHGVSVHFGYWSSVAMSCSPLMTWAMAVSNPCAITAMLANVERVRGVHWIAKPVLGLSPKNMG
jgi:hypothetical protein